MPKKSKAGKTENRRPWEGQGNPVKRMRWSLLDKIGEDEVFGLYLDEDTVADVLTIIFPDSGNRARKHFVEWLKQGQDGRWERWEQVKRLKGEVLADEANRS